MLRTCFLALAGIAVIASGPAAAEIASPALQVAQSSPTASEAPAVIAKAEEDDKGDAAAAATQDAPAAAPAASDSKPAEEKPAAEKPADAAEAAPKPAPPAEPSLTAAIDLSSQSITVSENGVAKYTWAISSGTQSHPSPRGTFRPQWTAKMWYSRKYDNAPMPHAVFVHDGVAIHATYATGMLGRPASHGCIRLSPTNAKTFYNLVQKHGVKNTRVSIFGTPKWGADPYVASRKSSTPRYAAVQAAPSGGSGWDWFGLGSSPSYAAKPVYPPQAYGKPLKRKPGAPAYYYASNGNVYLVKPNGAVAAGKPVRVGKKYYYSKYGYGYSSNW